MNKTKAQEKRFDNFYKTIFIKDVLGGNWKENTRYGLIKQHLAQELDIQEKEWRKKANNLEKVEYERGREEVKKELIEKSEKIIHDTLLKHFDAEKHYLQILEAIKEIDQAIKETK